MLSSPCSEPLELSVCVWVRWCVKIRAHIHTHVLLMFPCFNLFYFPTSFLVAFHLCGYNLCVWMCVCVCVLLVQYLTGPSFWIVVPLCIWTSFVFVCASFMCVQAPYLAALLSHPLFELTSSFHTDICWTQGQYQLGYGNTHKQTQDYTSQQFCDLHCSGSCTFSWKIEPITYRISVNYCYYYKTKKQNKTTTKKLFTVTFSVSSIVCKTNYDMLLNAQARLEN